MLFHAQTLLLVLLSPLTLALSNPHHDAHQALHERNPLPDSEVLEGRQIAAGGGAGPPIANPLQYPVANTAGSLFVQGGTTTATYKLYIQTFATTALGTWELGPTPKPGTIGLGDIQGEVGKTKSKRDVETDAPTPTAMP